MRKRKPLIKPEVNPCFYKGKIIGWQFREKITPSHGKYSFRFKLTFSDGSVVPKERSGYNTRKKCLEAKELAITQLHNHNFVAFEVTVKEFYDYWLYYHMIDNIKIANGTYVSYRNIIYNYINPKIGNIKLTVFGEIR